MSIKSKTLTVIGIRPLVLYLVIERSPCEISRDLGGRIML